VVERLKEALGQKGACKLPDGSFVPGFTDITQQVGALSAVEAAGPVRSVDSMCSGEVFASPGFGELMAVAYDDEGNPTGAYNYYSVSGGQATGDVVPAQWSFFGSSRDLLLGGPGEGKVRDCARCHISGGPVMKELRLPWVHWHGFGGRLIESLEGHMRHRTDAWTKERAEIAVENMTARDALRPVFCSVEFNIGAGIQSGGLAANSTLFANTQYVDLGVNHGTRIDLDEAAYDRLAEDHSQFLPLDSGSPAEDGEGTVLRDATDKLVHVERSDADVSYIRELVEQGIVSHQLVNSVRMIDFTRPVFSDRRCDLLDIIPEDAMLEGGQDATETIVELLREKGEERNDDEDTLFADLAKDLDTFDSEQNDREQAFFDTCDALNPAERTLQAFKQASQLRDLTRARDEDIIEHRAQLPEVALDVPLDLRIDEQTCQFPEEVQD